MVCPCQTLKNGLKKVRWGDNFFLSPPHLLLLSCLPWLGVRSLIVKIGCKQMQPDHVKWVTATSNATYLTLQYSICKNFRTRNVFENVIWMDPSNQKLWFCKNGRRDRFFILRSHLVMPCDRSTTKTYLVCHFCKIMIFDLRDPFKLHLQIDS